jgi:hypothetical protein
MYTPDDIEILNAKDVIKKRPKMYFGSRGINAESICSYVSEGALILGAKNVDIAVENEWYFISSDLDWMSVETQIAEVNEDSLFDNIFGFPEMGVNCFRWEALTHYFSDATFTTSNGETKTILGSESDRLDYLSYIESIGKRGRIIGFKFNKDA